MVPVPRHGWPCPSPLFSLPRRPALPAASPAPAGRRQRREGGGASISPGRPSPGRGGCRIRRARRREGLRPGGQQPQEVRRTAPARQREGGRGAAPPRSAWPGTAGRPVSLSRRSVAAGGPAPAVRRNPTGARAVPPLTSLSSGGQLPQSPPWRRLPAASAEPRGGAARPCQPCAASARPALSSLRTAAWCGAWRGDPRYAPALQVGEAAARPPLLSGCCPGTRFKGNGRGSAPQCRLCGGGSSSTAGFD